MAADQEHPASSTMNRRSFLVGLGTYCAVSFTGSGAAYSRSGLQQPILKSIPSSGQKIPAIGMGTWITFNVGSNQALRKKRLEVLRTFIDQGGGMIDSSPMYGSAEDVLGWCLPQLVNRGNMISATKIWTPHGGGSEEELSRSEALWGIKPFDLMQIHNLVDWERHLDFLLDARDQGRVRYIGITTSHGSRHSAIERVMTTQPIDFVQFTYNIVDREAEQRLLPIAKERGLGVVINRPFRQKQLFHQFADKPLPRWAAEFDCKNWAQFFLKFVISHDAVTCAIPATSRIDHMLENMGALYGQLPDEAMRHRMVSYISDL